MSLLLLLFTVVVLIPCSAAAPHAVQIIAPDESHTQLVVKEESIAFLRNLTGRMGFVGVVGPFHSGKSFLMNQLLPARGNDGKSGFKVGPTVQPETRGVWMWTEPMVVADKSGPLNVFLLDTEGLYASNVSESYDAKIFAVTTLLSSMLLYNSVKIIDQAAIDALEFLVRRSQLFALRAELQATTPRRSLDFRVQFPSLLWVVEDFFQDLQNLTATEWLHQLLLAHKVDDTNKPSSLLKIFNSVDCRTVFLPHSKRAVLQDLSSVKDNELTPEFHEDIASVRQLITEKVQPKLNAAGSDVSGAGYIQLVRVLVRAANEGSFPSVPSVWHAFVKQQVDQARNLSTVYFKDACKSLLEESRGLALPSPEEVTLGLTTAMASAKTIYSDVLIGLDDAPKDGFQRLTADLDSHSSLMRLTYENKLRDVLHAHAGQLKSQCHAYLSSLRLPLSPEELSAADNVTAFHAQFEADTARWRNTNQWRMAVDHFKRDTDLSMKTLVTENKNEIDRCLEKASTKAKSIYLAKCIQGLGNGVCSDRFEEVSSEAFATVVAVYTEEVPPGLLKSTTLKNLVRAFQASAESAARDQLKNQCSKENRDKILSVLLSLRATLVQDAKTEFSQLASRMPLLEEEIGEFGAQVQSRKLDEWKSRTGKCYGAFSVWMTETEALQKALAAQTNLNIQLNVAQYMQTVEPALARAKERIQLGSADYWLDFSWRSFAEHVVREELSRSTSLRGKVIVRAVKDFIEKEQSEYSGRFWSLALVVGVTVAVFGVLIGLALSIRRSK